VSSDEEALVDSSHQTTEFTQGHDYVMHASPVSAVSGSNFVSATTPSYFEEEKLIPFDSVNQLPGNFFGAYQVTDNPF